MKPAWDAVDVAAGIILALYAAVAVALLLTSPR